PARPTVGPAAAQANVAEASHADLADHEPRSQATRRRDACVDQPDAGVVALHAHTHRIGLRAQALDPRRDVAIDAQAAIGQRRAALGHWGTFSAAGFTLRAARRLMTTSPTI